MTTEQAAIREGDFEEWTLVDLRSVIEAQLVELRSLTDNININIRDVLLDLSYKLENILYCKSNCRCVDPLKDAHDLARDIANIAREVRVHDIAVIGERVAQLVYNYAVANDELWESDE